MKKIVLALCAALALTGCDTYSSGERAGVVSKISLKGLFCKTWEGEMFLGGLKSVSNAEGQSGVVANVFEFSVLDEKIASELSEVALTGERVAVRYEQVFFANPCKQDTDYVITAIERLPS